MRFLCALVVLCCGAYARAAEAPQLIVLFSVDTMRADRLSVYGYEKDTTPHFRAFAKSAVIFDNAFTPEPWTPSAHMSMLTGLYPKHHGLTANINVRDDIATLPEVLKRAGYATAGHTGMQWWFLPWRGFGRGFDEYSVPEGQRNVHETSRLGLDFLAAHPDAKAFLFLHTYDLHSHMEGTLPYGTNDPKFQQFSSVLGAPPAFTREGVTLKSPTAFLGAHNQKNLQITPEENTYMQALYEDGLARVDAALGDFFAELMQRGLYEKALIIITADHGEAFGEHDRYMHGDIYEANVRVPLLVRFPGGNFGGRHVASLARLIDLFPTVLDAAGIADAPVSDGQSLLPLLQGEATTQPGIYLKRGRWRGLRGPEFKFIEERGAATLQFFNVQTDPREMQDLVAGTPPQLTLFQKETKGFFLPAPAGWHVALQAGATPWRARFRTAAETRLAAVALEDGSFEERNDEVSEARNVEGAVELKAHARDVLHILPATATAPVSLQLRSESPFTVQSPKTPNPMTEIELTLDPSAPGVTDLPALPLPGETPIVQIWFVPGAAVGSAAKPLSPEAQEELDSLGYLDATKAKPGN